MSALFKLIDERLLAFVPGGHAIVSTVQTTDWGQSVLFSRKRENELMQLLADKLLFIAEAYDKCGAILK